MEVYSIHLKNTKLGNINYHDRFLCMNHTIHFAHSNKLRPLSTVCNTRNKSPQKIGLGKFLLFAYISNLLAYFFDKKDLACNTALHISDLDS